MRISRFEEILQKTEDSLRHKLLTFKNILAKYESVLIALSGGVDSSVVAALSKLILGDRAIAVTAKSDTLPSIDYQSALNVAREIGIRHIILHHSELKNPLFSANPVNRCYYCKKELIKELKKLAEKYEIPAILDGTNYDDLSDYRPGHVALKEEGVISPLAEAKITKNEVRKIAKILQLSVSEKPPMACLASRVPYGERITKELLEKIEKAERYLAEKLGLKQIRVRAHGGIARIEVGRNERYLFFDEKVMDEIAAELKKLGFTYITLDLEGYRSGSLNEPVKRHTS